MSRQLEGLTLEVLAPEALARALRRRPRPGQLRLAWTPTSSGLRTIATVLASPAPDGRRVRVLRLAPIELGVLTAWLGQHGPAPRRLGLSAIESAGILPRQRQLAEAAWGTRVLPGPSRKELKARALAVLDTLPEVAREAPQAVRLGVVQGSELGWPRVAVEGGRRVHVRVRFEPLAFPARAAALQAVLERALGVKVTLTGEAPG